MYTQVDGSIVGLTTAPHRGENVCISIYGIVSTLDCGEVVVTSEDNNICVLMTTRRVAPPE